MLMPRVWLPACDAVQEIPVGRCAQLKPGSLPLYKHTIYQAVVHEQRGCNQLGAVRDGAAPLPTGAGAPVNPRVHFPGEQDAAGVVAPGRACSSAAFASGAQAGFPRREAVLVLNEHSNDTEVNRSVSVHGELRRRPLRL